MAGYRATENTLYLHGAEAAWARDQTFLKLIDPARERFSRRVFLAVWWTMRRGRALKLALWSSGLLLALWLLFQLAVMVFGGTEITVDLKRQEVAAQTTLGGLNCRKELKAVFPFVAFTCESTRENR